MQVATTSIFIKRLTGLALSVAALAAQAQSQTFATPDVAAFTPSASLLGALNPAKTTLTSDAPVTCCAQIQVVSPIFTLDTRPRPLALVSTTVNTQTGAVQQAQLGYSLSITAPSANIVTTGGSLTLSNLLIDFDQHAVYADINGANGVGPVSHVNMWTFAQAGGTLNLALDAGTPNLAGFHAEVPTLAITSTGYDVFANSLGLTTDGKKSLSATLDYGRLNVGTVPEVSTTALMLVGLGAMGLLTRRRSVRGVNSR
jgi:hypothetical protein